MVRFFETVNESPFAPLVENIHKCLVLIQENIADFKFDENNLQEKLNTDNGFISTLERILQALYETLFIDLDGHINIVAIQQYAPVIAAILRHDNYRQLIHDDIFNTRNFQRYREQKTTLLNAIMDNALIHVNDIANFKSYFTNLVGSLESHVIAYAYLAIHYPPAEHPILFDMILTNASVASAIALKGYDDEYLQQLATTVNKLLELGFAYEEDNKNIYAEFLQQKNPVIETSPKKGPTSSLT